MEAKDKKKNGWDRLADMVTHRVYHVRRLKAATAETIPLHAERRGNNDRAVYALTEISVKALGFQPTYDAACDWELWGTVADALNTMEPAQDAECIRLFFGINRDRMEATEIAKRWHVSRATIFHRIERAKRKLAERLKGFRT